MTLQCSTISGLGITVLRYLWKKKKRESWGNYTEEHQRSMTLGQKYT